MGTSKTLIIVVSGPQEVPLCDNLRKVLRKSMCKGIVVEEVHPSKHQIPKSGSRVDLVWVCCRLKKEWLSELVDCLRRACAHLPNQQEANFWLRIPRNHSVPLASPSVVEDLWRSYAEYKPLKSRVRGDLDIELSLIAHCGKVGVEKYRKRRRRGVSLEKVAQEVIRSTNPLDEFDNLNFAF